MPTKKNRILITIVSLFALMSLVLGVFISQHLHSLKHVDPSAINGTVLDAPRELNDFELTGIDNKPFNKATLQGQWTLVFFGFTRCGSICPTTLAELTKMYHLVEQKGVQLPQIVMISLDPDRDSLEKLSHYVKAFNPQFYGAMGSESSLKQLTQEMGVAYAKIALQGNKNASSYDIEHTGTLMLLNPQGKLTAFFTMPHQASLLAKDYLQFVS